MRSFQLLTPLLLAAADMPLSNAAGLARNTTVGTVVGTVDAVTPGVKQWLGIPFAEPPLGPLRFLPPVKKTGSGVVLAQSPPASCQQWLTQNPNIFDLVPEFDPPLPWSEDCLYLNVIAPAQPKSEKLPVLIWIHGGEMTYGGINTPYEKPQKWVQRTQEHIVVQTNYRMNILGFPAAPGLNQSELNIGILDIRSATEWVRDNIANFGGDPSKIVFWGQAAGAGLQDAYQYAYYDDPIVSGLIMQSGAVTMAKPDRDLNQTSWAWVAKRMNCTGSPEQVVECMRGVDAGTLEKLLQTHADSGAAPALYFGATTDGSTVFTRSKYLEMAASKDIPKLPILLGTNHNEGADFVPYDAEGVNITQTEIKEMTLSVFQCFYASESAARVQGGGKTWRYYYNGNFSNISPKPWMGAYHFAEIPLIAGTHSDFRGNSTPFEWALSEHMQDLWLAFAKDPDAGLTKAGWPEYTGPNGTVLVFGEDGKLTGTRNAAVLDAEC